MRWGDYSCNPYKHKKMCYANPLWMAWIESEGNKKECSWKKKGAMKGDYCVIYSLFIHPLLLKRKKIVANWSILLFKSDIQII